MLVSGSKKGSRTPLLVSSSCSDSGSSRCFCRDRWEVTVSWAHQAPGWCSSLGRGQLLQTNQWLVNGHMDI